MNVSEKLRFLFCCEILLNGQLTVGNAATRHLLFWLRLTGLYLQRHYILPELFITGQLHTFLRDERFLLKRQLQHGDSQDIYFIFLFCKTIDF